MVDINFVSQMLDSMGEFVLQLERAINGKDEKKANEVRAIIFDLHIKLDKELSKNV